MQLSENSPAGFIADVGKIIAKVGIKIHPKTSKEMEINDLQETSHQSLRHKKVMSLNDKTLIFKEMTGNRERQDKIDRPDARRDGTNSRPRRMSGAPQGPNPRCAAPLPQDGALSAIYIIDNEAKAKRLISFQKQM